MKKTKSRLILFSSILIVIFIIFQMFNGIHENPNRKPVEVKKVDINSKLPYTVQVEESDQKPETIAYRIWFDFMNQLVSEGAITNKSFTRFTKLSGDENYFIVAVVFQVQLPEGTQKIDYGWGKMQETRVVPNIVWKLSLKKEENLTYTLTNIERTTDTQIGLPPVETLEEYRKNVGIEEPSKKIDYEIKDDKLRVTYDGGKKWRIVPVAVENLLSSGTNGTDQQFMDRSYVITPEITAFVLNKGLSVLVSRDKGKSWNEVLVSGQLPSLRMRILGFTSDKDGYLIVTGDKTMSWEAHFVFKTNDGGENWYNAGSVKDVYSLVTDGGFINDQLGFISFGELRYEAQPPIPNLYRTIDGGANWERVEVPIPEEYQGYFTIAEIPTFHGTEGTLLVNQGPQGDYLGGKVLAKFTSKDQGKTWSFAGLVDPDGVLGAMKN
ncbi:WD40/YVTN/BNR-like repeat-containing protein [Neobacillus sp. SAB-20_R2A]|uniref:WD40/YVTN/BNR-like repeat-containing protein n=1 Tax=Neobacillus sp. SAB-20_R2A TaxID=3120519 RepID=UPI003C6E9711